MECVRVCGQSKAGERKREAMCVQKGDLSREGEQSNSDGARRECGSIRVREGGEEEQRTETSGTRQQHARLYLSLLGSLYSCQAAADCNWIVWPSDCVRGCLSVSLISCFNLLLPHG